MEPNNQLSVTKIDGAEFGALVALPAMYDKNKLRVENAKIYTDTQIKAVELADIATVDITFMENLMLPVRELRSLLAEAKKEVSDERKPHTQKMDEIKSLFTAIEKDFDTQLDRVKKIEDNWEREKINRKRLEDEKKEKEIKKQQERVTLLGKAKTLIIGAFSGLVLLELNKMRDAYYAKTVDTIDAFCFALLDWSPELSDVEYQRMCMGVTLSSLLFNTEELNVIVDESAIVAYDELNLDFKAKLTNERDRLIELTPSRKKELIENDPATIAARISNEKAELQNTIQAEQNDKAELIQQNTEADKINVAFEIESQAEPMAEKAKGTVVKKKYELKTHKGFTAIIQQWVTKEMATLTIEELQKKLSFMVTAANKRLNDGEKLVSEGLNVVDDISTRVQKTLVS